MRLTSWSAFKLSLGIYLMGYWLSTLSIKEPLFIHFNQSSIYPENWWLWLQDHHLLSSYLFLLSLSGLGLIIDKFTRISAIINLINLLLLYHFTNGILISPSTPFFGWVLLWLSFFPQELSKEDKKIWWILIATGYFCSGLGKYLSFGWATGNAVSTLSVSAVSYLQVSIADYPLIKKMLTVLTMVVEMGGIFIIWWDWGRKFLWYAILPFLFSIVLFMNVPEVGLLMIILNLALWEDSPSCSELYSRLLIGYNTFIKKKKSKS